MQQQTEFMQYPEEVLKPIRSELTAWGVKELRTPEEVERILPKMEGTTLLYVNSMCGCAMGSAKPALKEALKTLKSSKKQAHIYTVFAGQDMEATAKAREFLLPYAPSSPAFYILKQGKVVFAIERQDILRQKSYESIAMSLIAGFEKN